MRSLKVSRIAMLRRSRALVVSRRLWKTRLVFWAGALAIGAISAGFAWGADYAQGLFILMTQPGSGNLLPLVLTPLGFVVCALASSTWFPGAQGSGIPQAIASRHLRDRPDRGGLLSLRIAIGKIFLTVAGLACGASVGREGPTVQIGAAIMLQSARVGRMANARGLILAGSAAGVAAAFNTPLAGIVFAIEEMGRTYQARTNGVVLSAVIIAGLASLGILGSYTYFGVSYASATFPQDALAVVVCGLVGGLMGGLFSRLVIALTRRIRRWRTSAPRWRAVQLAFAAGMITAVVGLACNGETFGTGYDQARAAVEGEAPTATYFLGKFLATLAATVSGIPGGLFAPSLSVGAGLGASVAVVLGSSIGIGAIVGMAGYFAGVTQAPMTAFVIIFEMTGNHDNVIAIMVAAMLGYGTSRFVAPEPVYHALSRLFIADALRQRRAAAAQAADVTGSDKTTDQGSPVPPAGR
ncbi:chloride channel protein [Phaeovulum sp.]|uniref:chloride channel protein n=1 Tax=Phaeovulum sp. TaxID=2934796 RepID=UPI0039E5B197